MTKVLVTGAKGMLGQDLSPILRNNGYEVIETDIHNLDITNSKMVEAFLVKEKPEIVVHCAAYTNVDKAEDDIETARLVNVTGTENIAKVCKRINALMVYISTDYVFDGLANTPYQPADTTAPLNNYGLTKLEGEGAVRNYVQQHYICRTSWLYGLHGKNFVETMISLANKPEIKVVDDQIGCPTWTVELANAIVKILQNKPYGTYHVCGSGETSWYNFAKEIFHLLNLNVNLIPCSTDDFPRSAKRPRYSVMNNKVDNEPICRDWKIALNDYLALRTKNMKEK